MLHSADRKLASLFVVDDDGAMETRNKEMWRGLFLGLVIAAVPPCEGYNILTAGKSKNRELYSCANYIRIKLRLVLRARST